jgi:hypothetical protein
MKRFSFALPVLFAITLLGLTSRALADQDITGKWTSEFDSGVGHQKYTFDIKVDGEKITGKAHREVEGSDPTDTDLTEGKIKGDDVSFVEVLSAGGQDLRIEYKGKIVGDEIHLTRAVADIATSDIVLKRQAATTQPSTEPAAPAAK